MRSVVRVLLIVLAAGVATAFLVGPALAGASGTTPTVTVRSSDFGRVLFDGSNRALYAFTRDPRAKTTCYGACADAWPPYTVRGTLRAGSGARRALLGTTRRRDGTRQLTYAGRPLYYYVHDPRGKILCQNVREFGGLWLVVRPSGKPVR